jgi:hypothetical protein
LFRIAVEAAGHDFVTIPADITGPFMAGVNAFFDLFYLFSIIRPVFFFAHSLHRSIAPSAPVQFSYIPGFWPQNTA